MSVRRTSFSARLLGVERRLRTAAERYGTSRKAIALRLLDLYRQRGFRPGEALELGLADPALSEATLSGCFTKDELFVLQDQLNPRELTCLTEDKSIFYPLCEALGLPVPKTYAVVSRTGGWVEGGVPLSGREAFRLHFAESLPETFVTKPAAGVYGEGVSAWTRSGCDFVDHTGLRRSPSELHESLCSDPKYDRFVIQERLENHAELTKLTGCPFLQTVRAATLIEASARPRVLYAEWKLIVGNNVSDNFMGGKSGNLTANIALGSGALGPAKRPSPDGVGSIAVPVHPVTGVRLEGVRLPDWHALEQLVVRAALLFQPLRTVGWDVALTPRGPVLVEGNRWWDPPNDSLLGPAAPGVVQHEMIEAAARLRREGLHHAE